jgi:hypothetical protein
MTYWLDIFTPKSWEEFKKAGATISGFPERRWRGAQRIDVGDILVCYMAGQCRWFAALEVMSKAFRDNAPIWTDNVYPIRLKVKPLLAIEPPSRGIAAKATLSKLKLFSGLKNIGLALRTAPRIIYKQDGDLLMSELKRLASSELLPTPIQGVRIRVSHRELIDMLCEIGKTLGFISKSEEETPDKAYRCDVTWRDYEHHSPSKVFEVELSKNIEHALSSLLHASHIWRSEQLYLIIADEADFARVEKLVERPLLGAFSEISRKLRAYPWSEVNKLYEVINASKEFIARLAER